MGHFVDDSRSIAADQLHDERCERFRLLRFGLLMNNDRQPLAIHLPLMVVGRLLPAARRIPPTAWLALAALGWILSWSWWLDLWRSRG